MEIIRLAVLGFKYTEIDNRVGRDKQTVSNVVNSQLVQERLAVLRAGRDESAVDIRKKIESLAPKAIALLEDVLDGETSTELKAGDQIRAAVDLLDRAGFKPPQEIHVKKGVVIAHLDTIKKRARELRILKETPYEDSEDVGSDNAGNVSTVACTG